MQPSKPLELDLDRSEDFLEATDILELTEVVL
jgi:hypothetical protein